GRGVGRNRRQRQGAGERVVDAVNIGGIAKEQLVAGLHIGDGDRHRLWIGAVQVDDVGRGQQRHVVGRVVCAVEFGEGGGRALHHRNGRGVVGGRNVQRDRRRRAGGVRRIGDLELDAAVADVRGVGGVVELHRRQRRLIVGF